MNTKALVVPVTVLLMCTFAGCGGGRAGAEVAVPVGDPASGREVFLSACRDCHGTDATGIRGAGADLTTSAFIRSRSDSELVAFVKVGRPMNDPMNRTGIAMPPYGANPRLTDQELADAVAFLRTLLDEATVATSF